MNRRIAKVRERAGEDGLNRREAERALRRLVEAESLRPSPTIEERPRTVDDAVDALRERLEIQGARLSYPRPLRRGKGDANPDLQFLTLAELRAAGTESLERPQRG